MPSGYEKSDDYGGPEPSWPVIVAGSLLAFFIAAGWWFIPA